MSETGNVKKKRKWRREWRWVRGTEEMKLGWLQRVLTPPASRNVKGAWGSHAEWALTFWRRWRRWHRLGAMTIEKREEQMEMRGEQGLHSPSGVDCFLSRTGRVRRGGESKNGQCAVGHRGLLELVIGPDYGPRFSPYWLLTCKADFILLSALTHTFFKREL